MNKSLQIGKKILHGTFTVITFLAVLLMSFMLHEVQIFAADADPVADANDLDDDNDGILDVDECTAWAFDSGVDGPITTGVTFDITSADPTSRLGPHILNSVTFGGETYDNFVAPDGYTSSFPTLSSPFDVQVYNNGTPIINYSSPAYDSTTLLTMMSRDLTHYQRLNSDDYSASHYDLTYNVPFASARNSFLMFTERFGNNSQRIEAIDANGTLFGTPVTVLGNQDYVDTGHNIFDSTAQIQNAEIAIVPLDDLAPVGSLIYGLRVTFPGGGPGEGSNTLDGPDGKIFIIAGTQACDTDGDGVPNSSDLDSDNDGISDLVEAGLDPAVYDPDMNGVIDGPQFVDGDGDGLADSIETAFGPDSGADLSAANNDGVGATNMVDLDTDNDGIPDVVEVYPTLNYSTVYGTDGDVSDDDLDGDGIIGIFDPDDAGAGTHGGLFPSPVDTDGDGAPDYLDTDSDNDGTDDTTESGITLSGADANNDGADDVINTSFEDPNGDVNDPQTFLTNLLGDTTEVAYRESNNAPTDLTIDGGNSDTIVENNTASSTVGVLATTDADTADTHTYTFCGGADDSHFSFSGSNLVANPSFDFEAPVDADTDNVYEVCIRTTDNGAGNLSYDETITVTVTDVDDIAPAVPVSLATTSVGGTSVGLSWAPSADNVGGSGTSFYTVYRDGVLVATTSATTFTDTGLLEQTAYDYEVSATDVAGNVSARSAVLTVTTPDTSSPAAPLMPDLQASSDSGDSDTDNVTNDDTATFDLRCTEIGSTLRLYSNNPVANTALGTTACGAIGSATVTALPAMVEGVHLVTYTETDTSGNTSSSSPSLTVLVDVTDPDQPTGLTNPSVTRNTATVAWSPAADNAGGSGTSFYTVYRDGTMIATTTSISFADTGLTLLTSYDYAVRATDVAGNESPLSAALTVTTNDAPGIAQSVISITQAEGATTDYTLVLDAPPTSPVTIALTIDTVESSISTNSVVFTAANYNIPQTITVTAVVDGIVDTDQTGTISYTVTSLDADYNGYALADVSVTALNVDVPSSSSGGGGTRPVLAIETITPQTDSAAIIGSVRDDNDWKLYIAYGTAGSPLSCSDMSNHVAIPGMYTSNDEPQVTLTNLRPDTSYDAVLCGTKDGSVRLFSSADKRFTTLPVDRSREGSAMIGLDTIDSDIRFGSPDNDPTEVRDLEKFLNAALGLSLPVDGVYGPADVAAVREYQAEFERAVLSVWGIDMPTGFVGITTRLHMNARIRGQVAVCPAFKEWNGGVEIKADTGVITQSEEVGRTQDLLRDLGFYAGPTNRYFGPSVTLALNEFQETFHVVMLDPWGITEPTGYKYKTTNKFMNYMVGCDIGPIELEGVGIYDGYGLDDTVDDIVR